VSETDRGNVAATRGGQAGPELLRMRRRVARRRAAERAMDSMRVVINFVIIQLARQVRGVPKKIPDQSIPAG
jgi:hypothetical protein